MSGSGLEPMVGPVLVANSVGAAVAAALAGLNRGLIVDDHGSYLRVRASGRCVLTRAAVEAHLGRTFVLPVELEAVMPSFAGRLRLTDDGAEWLSAAGSGDPR